MRSRSSARISNSFSGGSGGIVEKAKKPAAAVGVATAQVSSSMSTLIAEARSALATHPVSVSAATTTAADAARARGVIRPPGRG